METATKICKVCGKEYPYCRTERKVAGVFRWQDVACCVEHGSEYLEKVIASRNGRNEPQQIEEVKADVKPEEKAPVESSASKKMRKTAAKSAW